MTTASPTTTTPRETRATAAIPRAYGLMAVLLGVAFWPLGAWYTAVGWAWVLNWLLALVALPWRVPTPEGVYGIAAAAIIGGIYSAIELSPPRRKGVDWVSWLMLFVVWLFVIISDVGTTYAGMTQPSGIAAVLAILLTFAPDQATMRGVRILRGKPLI